MWSVFIYHTSLFYFFLSICLLLLFDCVSNTHKHTHLSPCAEVWLQFCMKCMYSCVQCVEMTIANAPVWTGCDKALQPAQGRKQQIWCGMPDVFIEHNSLFCNLTVWNGLSATALLYQDAEHQSMKARALSSSLSFSQPLGFSSCWDALRLIHESHLASVTRLSHILLLFWHVQ